MPRIETAIKALTGAIEKEEIPTLEDITEIHRLVAQLVETMIPSDNESSSGEDVSSVEEDSDEEEESPTSCDSESSERRTYKKGQRSKGYALYIKTGGTRAKWSNKSDKYKDNYYERHSNK